MERQHARARYEERLWQAVRDVSYPSPTMLDRLERQLRSKEDVEAYVELLLEKSDGHFPSLQILARIERMTDALELAEMAEGKGA